MLDILKVSNSPLTARSSRMANDGNTERPKKVNSLSYSAILSSGDAVLVELNRQAKTVNYYRTSASTGVTSQLMVTSREDAYFEHKGELVLSKVSEDPGVLSSGVNFVEQQMKDELYNLYNSVPENSKGRETILEISRYSAQISKEGKGLWQHVLDWWGSW